MNRAASVRKTTGLYPSVENNRPKIHITHCNENLIYVFPEKELRGLSLNFNIHVSVGDLYVPRIGPHIFLQQIGRPIMGIYK
jgi:hypothetical protein